jgi:hypothetical protein
MGARTRGLANNVLSSGKLDATDAISGTIAAGNIANDSLTSATTYGSITGGVPAVASDPPSPAEGDIWYNTTTGALRFRAQQGAWASGGSLNTARFRLMGAGTKTAALATGGFSTVYSGATELYDGTSWTEVSGLNVATIEAGSNGTQTSALIYGGRSPTPTTKTESWNGTSWTEVNNLNQDRNGLGGAGADNTSALGFGGYQIPGSRYVTESWNGTSWTEVNDLNSIPAGVGFGTQTSAIASGGSTESWNGTSWTEVSDLNTPRFQSGTSGLSNSSGLLFGGTPEPAGTAATEEWNGTSWTEVNDLNAGEYGIGGAAQGTTSASLAFGGGSPPAPSKSAATEEWSYSDTTFTVG